jgi:PAS domain-containing protein
VTDEQSLLENVATLRRRMAERLAADGLDVDRKREMSLALQELDVLWDELRKQAALFLHENQRYADFFEYAPDAYVITDAAGQVLQANRAAAELLGPLVGQRLADHVPARMECSVRALGGERRCCLIRPA